MNKTELIDKIAASAELSKADAKKALDATLDAIKNALVDGDKIALIGFGTFSVNERPAREGINPATKEKIQNHLGCYSCQARKILSHTWLVSIYATWATRQVYHYSIVCILIPSHETCVRVCSSPDTNNRSIYK